MLLFFSRQTPGELLLWGWNPLRPLMLFFSTCCAHTACECTHVKQCPPSSLICLFPMFPVSWHVPLPSLLPAGSSTDLCVPSSPTSPSAVVCILCHTCGLGHCLPFFSVHPFAQRRYYWLNSRAPSAVPMGLCPLEFRSIPIFFLETLLLFLPIIGKTAVLLTAKNAS